jgi:hypothetical protein
MPVHFVIDPFERLVVYVVEGNATREEAAKFLDAVISHRDFERGFNFLGDRRDVVRGQTPAYVYGVADEVNERKKELAPCRWAVIVADESAYAMTRMWGIMTEYSGVYILPFHTAEAATDWLGVDKEHVPLRYVPGSRHVVRIGV